MQKAQCILKRQKEQNNPQVNLYNRHFYLRGAQHEMRQIQYEDEIKQLANKPKITPSSYGILSEQLEDKLTATIAKYCQNKASPFDRQTSTVDFMELQHIVCELCQIPEDKAGLEMEHFLSQLWLVLGEYQISSEIKTHSLFTLLRILLDPYNLNINQCIEMFAHLPQFHQIDLKRSRFLEEYPELTDETLSVPEIIKLWRKIRYSNPAFARLTPRSSLTHKFTFKPEISQRSQQLASKSLKKYLQTHRSYLSKTITPASPPNQPNEFVPYLEGTGNWQHQKKPNKFDILFMRKLEKDSLVPKVSNEDNCSDFGKTSKVSRTAKPQEIREIVNNLHVVKPRKSDKDLAMEDELKELKVCTFSPKINKNYNSKGGAASPTVKGYSKQVTRVQKGRQEKEKKKQAFENLGRVKNFSKNYSKSPNKTTAPSFIERDSVKLILQINIDGERIEKLSLKGDQNPHLVSKKFVIKHGLQNKMIEVLEKLVEEQLKIL